MAIGQTKRAEAVLWLVAAGDPVLKFLDFVGRPAPVFSRWGHSAGLYRVQDIGGIGFHLCVVPKVEHAYLIFHVVPVHLREQGLDVVGESRCCHLYTSEAVFHGWILASRYSAVKLNGTG